MAARDTSDQGHAGRPRNSRGRYTKRPGTAERDAEACRLRTRGQSYDQIARTLGFRDRSGARRAVRRALAASVQEPAGELRALELARLDDMTRRLYDVLAAHHYHVAANGNLTTDPATGKPLIDTGPVVMALRELRQVSESRRRLLGMDAPARTRVEVVDDEVARALVNELEAELAALGEMSG